MPSHIHLIFRSSLGDPTGLIRDFKGFTSRKMLKIIEENPQESRKEWLLWMFDRAGKKNSNVKLRQFWQQNNKPIEIWTLKVFEQKLKYIHNNPLESGFVTDTIDWKYSSARNYGNDDQTILEIDLNQLIGTSKMLAPAGVSPKNPNATKYEEAARKEFGN